MSESAEISLKNQQRENGVESMFKLNEGESPTQMERNRKIGKSHT